jgi:hypothetical protein
MRLGAGTAVPCPYNDEKSPRPFEARGKQSAAATQARTKAQSKARCGLRPGRAKATPLQRRTIFLFVRRSGAGWVAADEHAVEQEEQHGA